MEKIDFSYCFATPHRMTVCLPDDSNKLLCDASESGFCISWSDRAVRDVKYDGLFEPLKASEKAVFSASVNGQKASGSFWGRMDGVLPVFSYRFSAEDVTLVCDIASCRSGDIIRMTAENSGGKTASVRAGLRSTSLFNLLWTHRGSEYNAMTGNMKFPPTQAVFFSPARCEPSEIFNIENAWELAPGEKAEGYIIRPFDSWIKDLPKLAATDWAEEFDRYVSVWTALLARAAKVTLPDKALEKAYYACLADMFVMREPQKSGHVVSTCGTEVYRCTNPCEPLYTSALLARLGYLAEGRDGMEFSLSSVEPDGNWNEPAAWPHDSWLPTGMKCLAVLEYFSVTHDMDFLRENYPRMLGAVRWNERKRAESKNAGEPACRGLMPRGMGDGGLKYKGDMYGVFYPQNFFCCYAARAAAEAAHILGAPEEAELLAVYGDYLACLKESLRLGAMTDPDGSRWIGGCPNDDGGSRWSAVDCVYPCGLFGPGDPLVSGTIAKIDREISEGGLPLGMGWIKDGLWVAAAIDNISVVNMLRGEGQKVMDYLYAAINHASPFITWCEERTPEKNAVTRTGDTQHSWTPLAVCKTVTSALVCHDGDMLRLGWCFDADWAGNFGVGGYLTPWGKVSFNAALGNTVKFDITLDRLPPKLCLGGEKLLSVCGARLSGYGKGTVVLIPESAHITAELTRPVSKRR